MIAIVMGRVARFQFCFIGIVKETKRSWFQPHHAEGTPLDSALVQLVPHHEFPPTWKAAHSAHMTTPFLMHPGPKYWHQ